MKNIFISIFLLVSFQVNAYDFEIITHEDGRVEYTNINSQFREKEDVIQYIYVYTDNNRIVISNFLPEHIVEFTVTEQICRGCLREPVIIKNNFVINKNIGPLSNRFILFNDYINASSLKYNVPINLIKAVIHTESYANPNAVSPKGAAGLMQIMPATGLDLGITPNERFIPSKNIDAGTRYLRQMLDIHNNDLVLALAAYNAGQGNVRKYNGIPPFEETRKYIDKVIHLMNYY